MSSMTRHGLPGALAIAVLLVVSLAVPGRVAHAAGSLADRLCLDRTPCKIAKQYSAGRGAGDTRLRVVELALDAKDPGSGNACSPHQREFWLVSGPENGGATRKIMSLCNNGYGAAGLGEDMIEVSGNRLVHHQNGGSSWRWSVTRTLSLDPLRVVSEKTSSFNTRNPNAFEDQLWDWRRFAGHGKVECEPKKSTHRFQMLPLLDPSSLPPAANPALGSCALATREDDTSGHVVFGKPAPKGTGARLRVLALGERTLLVTVDDSQFATGRNWVHSDHVEVWQGKRISVWSECRSKGDLPLLQFGIRAADGKLFSGHVGGKRAKKRKRKAKARVIAHAIDRRTDGVTLRLRLKLPRKISRGIAVVYSKTRNGRQARLTATSRFKFGKAKTLGGSFSIVRGAAQCAVRNGRLDVVRSGVTDVLLKN